MKFCSGIHGAQRMNPDDFGDPLTFPLAPPSGQKLNLSNTLVYLGFFLFCFYLLFIMHLDMIRKHYHKK